MRYLVVRVLVAIALGGAGSVGAAPIDATISVTRDGNLASLAAAQSQLVVLDGSLASIEVAIKEIMNEIARLQAKEDAENDAVKSDWEIAISSSLAKEADAYAALAALFGGPGCILCFTNASSGGTSFDPASIPSDLSPEDGPLMLSGMLNPVPLQMSGAGTFAIDCETDECATRVSYQSGAPPRQVPEPSTPGLFVAGVTLLALRQTQLGKRSLKRVLIEHWALRIGH